ncbi:g513 [Coccomyxa viridis]|uniref:G513 protein n=1 Tax=Coccomyxa viridis TaxID=1274662 RepID=A0ABP1FG33_9CHLO
MWPQILKEPAIRDATLGELLADLSGLPNTQLQQLIDLGAVYYGDPECPANPPKWRRAKRLGADAINQHISEGQWIRIHPRPKRYPAASTTDWASTVLYLDDDICVVNKPAGIPVQSHESNSAETVPHCLEQALGIKLWMLHRLDVCTTGVLVLARNEAAARRFTADMTAHSIRKQYKALVYKPVDAGTRLEHHMYNGPFGSSLDVMAGEGLRARGPRLLSSEQRPGWKQCALTVTECQEIPVHGEGVEPGTWLLSLLRQDALSREREHAPDLERSQSDQQRSEPQHHDSSSSSSMMAGLETVTPAPDGLPEQEQSSLEALPRVGLVPVMGIKDAIV